MEPQSKPASTTATRALGLAASKAQRALEEFRAGEKRRRQAAAQELADLEKAAAAEGARLRKAARERRHQQEAQVATRLGRMVIAALRRKGRVETVVTLTEIEALLPPEYRQMLHDLLAPTTDEQPQASIDTASIDPSVSLDIDLGA